MNNLKANNKRILINVLAIFIDKGFVDGSQYMVA